MYFHDEMAHLFFLQKRLSEVKVLINKPQKKLKCLLISQYLYQTTKEMTTPQYHLHANFYYYIKQYILKIK